MQRTEVHFACGARQGRLHRMDRTRQARDLERERVESIGNGHTAAMVMVLTNLRNCRSRTDVVENDRRANADGLENHVDAT